MQTYNYSSCHSRLFYLLYLLFKGYWKLEYKLFVLSFFCFTKKIDLRGVEVFEWINDLFWLTFLAFKLKIRSPLQEKLFNKSILLWGGEKNSIFKGSKKFEIFRPRPFFKNINKTRFSGSFGFFKLSAALFLLYFLRSIFCNCEFCAREKKSHSFKFHLQREKKNGPLFILAFFSKNFIVRFVCCLT